MSFYQIESQFGEKGVFASICPDINFLVQGRRVKKKIVEITCNLQTTELENAASRG